jgi:hypothetical protein
VSDDSDVTVKGGGSDTCTDPHGVTRHTKCASTAHRDVDVENSLETGEMKGKNEASRLPDPALWSGDGGA